MSRKTLFGMVIILLIGAFAVFTACKSGSNNAAASYTVNFESNGGTPVPAQNVPAGGRATKPQDPIMLGFTFVGWYTDNGSFSNEWRFSYAVNGNTTLYANWTQNAEGTVTVYFNSNGGSAIAAENVAIDGFVPEPAIPTKGGFTFVGWYSDIGLTNQWIFDADTVSGQLTLYAKWQENGTVVDGRKAYNPIITSMFSADPSAHVWPGEDGRLYLYPSHDVFPPRGCNLMDKYHVFSTDNMVDWIDHGEIMSRDDLDLIQGIGPRFTDAEGPSAFMWAPDAAYSTSAPGKGPYFFIFPFVSMGGGSGWGDNWTLGIAWSDQPHAGFKTSGHITQLKDSNGTIIRGSGTLIDPCIFYDEASSSHYLVVGGSQQARVAKLNADMVSLAEPWTDLTSQLTRFHEGPWMFTRVNDAGTKLYYLMYASGNPAVGGQGSHLSYATSTTGPKGPWEFKSDILTAATTDTNHGSIVQFKGKWYLFYHTAVLSGGQNTLRSVSVDELTFNADGTINMVTQTEDGVRSPDDPTSDASLNSKFGAGNWRKELNYPDYKASLTGGGEEQLIGTYLASDLFTQGKISTVDGANPATTQLALYLTHYGTGPVLANQWECQNKTGAIHDFHIANSYAEFRLINGGSGGRARLEVSYGTLNGGSMLVTVNGTPLNQPLTMNPTGDWEIFTGVSSVMIDVNPGTTNAIRFSSASGNITGIKIYLQQ